jgi:hypothetical protein
VILFEMDLIFGKLKRVGMTLSTEDPKCLELGVVDVILVEPCFSWRER